MRCPGCSTEVDFGSDICGGCGVRLLELYERRAWDKKSSLERRVSDRRAAASRPYLAVSLAALGAAVVALCGLRARGRPLPEGALTMPGQAFAFVPPAGWAIETEPAVLRFRRGSAAIVVSTLPRPLPSDARRFAPSLAAEAFDGASVKVLSASDLQMGGRAALRLEISGERAVLPSSNAGRRLSDMHVPAPQFESLELRGALILVEAGGRMHAIKAYSEKSDFASQRLVLQAFLDSFRPL